jgi:hypothetical protein
LRFPSLLLLLRQLPQKRILLCLKFLFRVLKFPNLSLLLNLSIRKYSLNYLSNPNLLFNLNPLQFLFSRQPLQRQILLCLKFLFQVLKFLNLSLLLSLSIESYSLKCPFNPKFLFQLVLPKLL